MASGGVVQGDPQAGEQGLGAQELTIFLAGNDVLIAQATQTALPENTGREPLQMMDIA